MPIRINLLAEAQAAEDLRRRDPVKRAALLGALLVGSIILWSAVLQVQIMAAKSELGRVKGSWGSKEKSYAVLTESLKDAAVVERKLMALNRLSTNRFLWGSLLNALQQTVVDKVQMTRCHTEQAFVLVEVPKKPPVAVERITIRFEAKDYGNPVEQNYEKFKAALSKFSFFQRYLQGVDGIKLVSRSQPVIDLAGQGKTYSIFSLECQFPEIKRDE